MSVTIGHPPTAPHPGTAGGTHRVRAPALGALRPLPGLGPVAGLLASVTALIVPMALLLAPAHPQRRDAAAGWLLAPALAVVCDVYTRRPRTPSAFHQNRR
ncbi:hypothetical protein [Streptomyces chartreusis]|uniref:hypothetical protein n=1 Tax=Streptomyces chartreusis TaxID=1969 RepID=UPI002E17159C